MDIFKTDQNFAIFVIESIGLGLIFVKIKSLQNVFSSCITIPYFKTWWDEKNCSQNLQKCPHGKRFSLLLYQSNLHYWNFHSNFHIGMPSSLFCNLCTILFYRCLSWVNCPVHRPPSHTEDPLASSTKKTFSSNWRPLQQWSQHHKHWPFPLTLIKLWYY